MTKEKEQPRWPFDPMQPGDHEPVRLPESIEHPQKQNPAPKKEKDDEQT